MTANIAALGMLPGDLADRLRALVADLEQLGCRVQVTTQAGIPCSDEPHPFLMAARPMWAEGPDGIPYLVDADPAQIRRRVMLTVHGPLQELEP